MCPVWLIYWHSMSCGNLETNLPLFSGIISFVNNNCNNKKREKEREGESVKDNKKGGREKRESRNSKRPGKYSCGMRKRRRDICMRKRVRL